MNMPQGVPKRKDVSLLKAELGLSSVPDAELAAIEWTLRAR